MPQDFDRFRSFAERYVIARAASFSKETEREEAWEAILNARSTYEQIGLVSKSVDVAEAQQADCNTTPQVPCAGPPRKVPLYPPLKKAALVQPPSITNTSGATQHIAGALMNRIFGRR